MPNLVGSRRADTDGGFGRINALSRPKPTSRSNELGPGSGQGEDLANALGMEGALPLPHAASPRPSPRRPNSAQHDRLPLNLAVRAETG